MMVNFSRLYFRWVVLFAATTLYLVLGSCQHRSVVSVQQVKDDVVGVWIASPQDAPYVKVEFSKSGTYRLWIALPYSNSWGNVTLTNTYRVDLQTDESGYKYPVVTLNGSTPMNYKILFKGATPMLWSTGFGLVPIQHNNENPWRDD